MALRNQAWNSALSASERRVLNLVRRHAPVTRAELASLCGLGAPSVTLLTRSLIDRGMICEAGRRSGGRGQPAIDLDVISDAAFSIGVSSGVDSVVVTMMDFAGRHRGERSYRNAFGTFDAAIEAIEDGVCSLLEEEGVDRARLAGIGLALSATFDGDHQAVFPSGGVDVWKGTDFVSRMTEAFRIPVWIENDASAATIAENLIGNPAGFESFVYFYFGNGIGGGAVIKGQPWTGANGNAGEFGFLAPRNNPRPSLTDLRTYLDGLGHQARTPDQVARLFATEPEVFEGWFDRIDTVVAELVFAATAVVDPDGIIFGGSMPPPLLQRLAGLVQFDQTQGTPRERLHVPPIVVSHLSGERAAAIGAATQPISGVDPGG